MITNLNNKFDLTVKRPQVLLFGNGLVYYKSWDEVIEDLKDDNINDSLKKKNIPYPIQSSILFSSEDNKRWNKYDEYFNKRKNKRHYEYHTHPAVEKIADLDFDAYLTTNYTYELERVFNTDYLKLSKKREYAQSTKNKKDTRRIKYTYNSFKYNNKEKKIWHIHGEARNKSSLIFTHNDYCRLVGDLTNINNEIGNKYEIYKNKFEIKSWAEYFIAADIYILGFGLDYSEIDIWWLLNRRVREKSGYGQIYFFEPYYEDKADKYAVLENFEIKHRNLGFFGNSDTFKSYNEFYEKAIEEIKKIIKGVSQ